MERRLLERTKKQKKLERCKFQRPSLSEILTKENDFETHIVALLASWNNKNIIIKNKTRQ